MGLLYAPDAKTQLLNGLQRQVYASSPDGGRFTKVVMEDVLKPTEEKDMTCMKKVHGQQDPVLVVERTKSNGSVENFKVPSETMSSGRSPKEYSKARSSSQNSGKSKLLRRSMAVNFGSSGADGDDMEQASHPRSENQSERLKVPDTSGTSQEESTLSKNPSKSDLKAFLVKTLKDKPKDRLPILKLERDFANLISSDLSKGVLTYEGMSSYYRMLVHRVAAYFDLEHNIDSSEKCVVVSKTNSSKIPEQSFQLYCSREYSDEELTSLPKSILRRSNTASSDDTPVSSRPGSPNTASNRHAAFKDKKSRSMEEREDDYLKAKARIFNQGSLSSQSSGEEKELLSPTNVNQSDAANKQLSWSSRSHAQDAQNVALKKSQQSGNPSMQHNIQLQQSMYATGNPVFNQQMNLPQPTYVQYPVEYVYVDRGQDDYGQMAGNRLGQQDVYMMSYPGPQQQQPQMQPTHLVQQQQQSTRQSSQVSASLQSEETVVSPSIVQSPTNQRTQQDLQLQQQQQQQQLDSQQYGEVTNSGQVHYQPTDASLSPVVFYQQGQMPIAQDIQSPVSILPTPQVQDVTNQLSAISVTSNPNDSVDESTAQTQGAVQYQETQRQQQQQQQLTGFQSIQQQQQDQPQRHYSQPIQLQPSILSSYPIQQEQQQPTSYIVLQQSPSAGQPFTRNIQPSYQMTPQGAVLGHMVQTPYGTSFVQVDPSSAMPRYPYAASATALPQQRPSSPLVLSPTYGASSPSPGPTLPIQNTPPPQQATSPPRMLQTQQVAPGALNLSPGGGTSPLAVNSSNFQFSTGPHLGQIPPKSPQEAQMFQFLRQREAIPYHHYQQAMHPGYGGMQGSGILPYNMTGTQPRPYIAVMPVQHPGPTYPIGRRPFNSQMYQGYRHVVAAYHPAGLPLANPLFPVFPPHRKSKSRKGNPRYNTTHGHGRKDKDHGHVLEAYDFSQDVTIDEIDELTSSLGELGGQISKINHTTQESPISDADVLPSTNNFLPIVLVTFKSSDKAHHTLKNFHHPKYKLRLYRKNIETITSSITKSETSATKSETVTTVSATTATEIVDIDNKKKIDSNENMKDDSKIDLCNTSTQDNVSTVGSENNNTLIDNKLDDSINQNAPLDTTKIKEESIAN